jgi:hypothetical protein
MEGGTGFKAKGEGKSVTARVNGTGTVGTGDGKGERSAQNAKCQQSARQTLQQILVALRYFAACTQGVLPVNHYPIERPGYS